jgi:hypothetical protein
MKLLMGLFSFFLSFFVSVTGHKNGPIHLPNPQGFGDGIFKIW